MSSSGERQHAPVFSAGLPIWVTAALRRAGVPILDFQTGYPFGVSESANFLVLFDSRIPANRESARQIRDLGATVIDTADAIEAYESAGEVDSHSTAGRQWMIAEIQTRMQAAGFYWVRIADFPYPYQTARASQPVGVLASHSTSSTVVARESDETSIDALCWRFRPEELQRWNNFRDNIALRCRSTNGRIAIEADFPPGRFRPTVELRRGHHVARLPLKAGITRIAAGSLVYQWSDSQSSERVAKGEFADVETATSITCIDRGRP